MSRWGSKQVVIPKINFSAAATNFRNSKFLKGKSQAPDGSERRHSTVKKPNNKCFKALKELKTLVNKAASKIPKAPAMLSPIKRCYSSSKIPITPKSKELQQHSNFTTRIAASNSKLALKTSLLTKKRNSKRLVKNEEKKAPSKRRGNMKSKMTSRENKRVEVSAQQEKQQESTVTSTCSVHTATCMISPTVADQPTVLATDHRFDDGYDAFARDPETGENIQEDCTACDPPVLGRDSEGWLESRESVKRSPSNSSGVSSGRNDNDSPNSCHELRHVCETVYSECSQALRTVDRIREEISFIQDIKLARKRRDKIPAWVRERYESSKNGRSSIRRSSSAKKIKAVCNVKSNTPSTRLKRGIRDSPMDAATATPFGASYCVNTCDQQRRREITDSEITDFLNLRGQTPINLSGSCMHQLKRIAEKDLEAPLQAELRRCLSRLAKLEFENRALKALVILKCGLPKHLGVHRFSRSGTPSTLAEDPEDCSTSEASLSVQDNYKVSRRATIDSAHEVFLNE